MDFGLQVKVLRAFYDEWADKGRAPSLRELRTKLGKGVTSANIEALIEDGLLMRFASGERGIVITSDARKVLGIPNREVSFVTALSPSVNHSHRNNGRGGRYKSPEAVAFVRETQIEAAKAMKDVQHLTGNHKMLSGFLGVELMVYLPNMRSDAHNRHKLLLDAMQGIVYANDAAVRHLSITARYDGTPRIEVEVIEL